MLNAARERRTRVILSRILAGRGRHMFQGVTTGGGLITPSSATPTPPAAAERACAASYARARFRAIKFILADTCDAYYAVLFSEGLKQQQVGPRPMMYQ